MSQLLVIPYMYANKWMQLVYICHLIKDDHNITIYVYICSQTNVLQSMHESNEKTEILQYIACLNPQHYKPAVTNHHLPDQGRKDN